MAGQRQPSTNYLDSGAIFEGKYRIVRELGRGGFGMVYLAYQKKMDRHVAIKVLKSGIGKLHHSAKERFLREVKIISKLRHPNTVTIHDFGETAQGVLYMVLEYIEGETVKQILRNTGAQPPPRALALGTQISRSLAEAHRHGVVHRDLKPANIMVTDLETEIDFVKVLDFGIARLLRTDERDLTSVGLPDGERELIGTPRYMSPEQVRGESLGPASDVYSVGLILYEMLVGEPAVQGDTTMALISQQISPEPLRLAGLRGLPGDLGELIRRATAKELTRRFTNAEMLTDVLDEALAAVGGAPAGSAGARKSGRFPTIDRSSQLSAANQTPDGAYRTDHFGAANAPAASPDHPGRQQPVMQRGPEPWVDSSSAANAAGSQQNVQQNPSQQPNSQFTGNNYEYTESSVGFDDLPPPPGDTNPFAVPDPSAKRRADAEPVDELHDEEGVGQFVIEFLRMSLFGIIAAIGLYIAFLVVSAIFGQFLTGNLKLLASLILAAAIPLLTALGENSKRERFEVVDKPYDRVVRVFVGTAIFSFGTAVLCSLAMSGAVVHELRSFPNWFMTDSQRASPAGDLNANVSLGLAQVVEEATEAIGIYSGKPHGDTGPATTRQGTRSRLPQPTRPSTRAKQQKARDEARKADEAPVESDDSAPTSDAPAKPGSQPGSDAKEDDEYIRW